MGITHDFGPKMAIFPTFFFTQYRGGQCILSYYRTKKLLSRLKKQEVQRVEKLTKIVEKLTFFKEVNQLFWSKNCHFSFFFLRIIDQENVFYDILERKNAFLGYKKKKVKKSKN